MMFNNNNVLKMVLDERWVGVLVETTELLSGTVLTMSWPLDMRMNWCFISRLRSMRDYLNVTLHHAVDVL